MNYNLIHLIMKESAHNKELNQKVNKMLFDEMSEYTKKRTTTLSLNSFAKDLEETTTKMTENSSQNH